MSLEQPEAETVVAPETLTQEREALIAELTRLETRLPHVPMTYTDNDGWLVTVKKFALPVAHEQRRVFDTAELTNRHMPQMILNAVSDIHQVSIEEIQADSKPQEVVAARHDAMYLIREMTEYSYPQIGKEVGGFDHTTAMYAYQKIEERLKKESALAERHTRIQERLNMYLRGELIPGEYARIEERLTALIDGDLCEFRLRELTGQQRVTLGSASGIALDGDTRTSGQVVWQRHGQHAQEALTAYSEQLRAKQITRLIWPHISGSPLRPHRAEPHVAPGV